MLQGLHRIAPLSATAHIRAQKSMVTRQLGRISLTINNKPAQMKKPSSFQAIKTLLVGGLLAATTLAFNAMADDNHWSPFNVINDGNGPYAYFADPANW